LLENVARRRTAGTPRASALAAAGSRDLALAWWTPGAAGASGPVLVSVTDFRIRRFGDLLRVYVEGLRMSRAWPSMTGAVGVWLWSSPLRKRVGSVSVWQRSEDLDRFVRWPRHRELMRRYRDAGALSSSTWMEERFDARRVWARAARGLGAGEGVSSAAGARS